MPPVEIGRAILKSALQRTTAGSEGARLVASAISGLTGTNVQTVLESMKTLVDGKVESTDPRLSDARTPTDLSVTNAKVATSAAIAESKLALASDAAAATPSRRTIGTGALQAAAGNHNHDSLYVNETDHTTAAHDTLKIDAGKVTDFGLGTVAKTLSQDLNTVRSTGFYMFDRNNALIVNEPAVGTGEQNWMYMVHIEHNAMWSIQYTYDFNNVAMYSRVSRDNGSAVRTWEAWKQIPFTSQVVLEGDSRLSDARTPTDASVSAAKMASDNKAIVICTSTTRPASPAEGQHIYETDTDNTMKNTGTPASPVWINAASAATAATETSAGVTEQATQAEVEGGTAGNLFATVARLKAELDRRQSLAAPTATIHAYAGSTAPTGYLLCQGQEVAQGTYPDLYAVLGATYGTAAAGNFKLPDLRGRAPIGSGTGDAPGATAHALGQKAGAETHLLTSAQSGLPAHQHNVPSGQSTVARTNTGANTAGIAAGLTDANTAANAAEAHPNMQPYSALNFIIKT